MKCFKYQDVPGIDKIGGDRPAEKFYKIVSSAAYNWDHSLVMSETYGAMGNIPWDTLYNVAMDQYSKGINMLIPHAVWFNDRDVTFEPELSHRNRLYNQGLYEFNTFLARLNMLLRNDDRFVTDVAMLYPIETMQGEHYFDGPLGAYAGGVKIPDMDYVQISQRLTNELGRDFQFLHPEVLQDACRVDKNGLTLANTKQYNTFRTLIVPSSKTISVANLAKILTFFEAGGQVIFTTQLPVKSTEPNADAQVVALMDKLLPEKLRSSGEPHTNPAGGRVVFLAKPGADALRNALARPSETFDVEFPEGIVPMRYIHKERAGKDIYYFANLNGKAFDSAVALRGKKRYELWNPHTGEVTALQPEYAKKGKDRFSLVRLRVEPSQSVFLVETK